MRTKRPILLRRTPEPATPPSGTVVLWSPDTWLRGALVMKDDAGALTFFTEISPDLFPGLVGWWKANGTLLTDGAASFASASSQYLSRDGTDFGVPAGGFTIAAWVKISGTGAVKVIAGKDNSGTRDWLFLVDSSEQLTFTVFDSMSAQRDAVASTPLSDGVWAFVVGQYDGVNVLASVNDGTPASTAIVNAPPQQSSADFLIGARDFGGIQIEMNGDLDAVAVWNKVLSAGEITSLYNGGDGLAVKEFSGSLLTSLVAGYDFDGPSGNLVKDYSGNGLTLTNNNGVTFAAGQVSNSTMTDADATKQASDASGVGNNVVQATANRPLYKTGILNGLPVLRFDGTNDYLANTFTLNQPCTILLVADSNTNSNRRLFSGGAAEAALIHTATTWQMNAGSALDSGITADTDPHVFAAVFNTTASRLWVDGVPGTAGSAGSNNPGGITLGADQAGANLLAGDIPEAFCFSRVLSNTEIIALSRYLGQLLGITVA